MTHNEIRQLLTRDDASTIAVELKISSVMVRKVLNGERSRKNLHNDDVWVLAEELAKANQMKIRKLSSATKKIQDFQTVEES